MKISSNLIKNYNEMIKIWQDAHGAAEKDVRSNYMLLFVRQSDMYTEVHFRRAIYTGDCKEDIRILVRILIQRLKILRNVSV